MIRCFPKVVVILSVFFIVMPCLVLAQTPQGMPAGIAAQVESLSSGWQTRAFNLANNLFLIVAFTSIAIAAARYAIEERTLHGFEHCFLTQLGLLAVPWALLKTASSTIPMLITDMTSTAQTVAGATTTMPLDIFKQGLALAASLMGGAVRGSIMTLIPGPLQGFAGQILGVPPSAATVNGVQGMIDNGINTAASLNPQVSFPMADAILFIGLGAALFIVVCFTLVATELLLAFVQTYMTASIGAINLGWGASPGTSSWASAYWGALMHSFIRLTVIYAVVVVGQSVAANWASELAGTRPANLIATLLEICGSSLMYAVIVKRIGNLASNLLSGRPAMGANDAVGMINDADIKTNELNRRYKK
jgi:P-type conjugative transfer protein TrbL